MEGRKEGRNVGTIRVKSTKKDIIRDKKPNYDDLRGEMTLCNCRSVRAVS